ncbi:MAG: twin-arginine translocation signal domain-containing protein [Chitinophagaceae bacterium]|nr:MAG: twin-arginine translocation signal domain-containing protein [Chitinophagaceae bacterium]
MERRDFLKATVITGGMAAFSTAASAFPLKKEKRQWYELREYTITGAAQREIIERYYRDAAIPALNRMGSKPVGVFRQYETKEIDRLFVLIPFSSADKFLGMRESLSGDKAYQAAAREYHMVSSKNAAYKRIQSSFLRAFTQLPSILLPEKKQRLYLLQERINQQVMQFRLQALVSAIPMLCGPTVGTRFSRRSWSRKAFT